MRPNRALRFHDNSEVAPDLRRLSPQRGQGLAEFVLITLVVAIVAIVAVRLFGRSVNCQFSQAGKNIDDTSTLAAGCRQSEPPVDVAPQPTAPEPPPLPAAPPPQPPPAPSPPAAPSPAPSPQPSLAAPLPPSPNPSPLPPPPSAAPSPVSSPSPAPSPTPSPEQLVDFDNPTFGGAPLDACLHYGIQCGQVAADAFCQSRGYIGAKSFVQGAPITKTGIPDGTYCDFSLPPTRAVCQVFTKITCRG